MKMNKMKTKRKQNEQIKKVKNKTRIAKKINKK